MKTEATNADGSCYSKSWLQLLSLLYAQMVIQLRFKQACAFNWSMNYSAYQRGGEPWIRIRKNASDNAVKMLHKFIIFCQHPVGAQSNVIINNSLHAIVYVIHAKARVRSRQWTDNL